MKKVDNLLNSSLNKIDDDDKEMYWAQLKERVNTKKGIRKWIEAFRLMPAVFRFAKKNTKV